MAIFQHPHADSPWFRPNYINIKRLFILFITTFFWYFMHGPIKRCVIKHMKKFLFHVLWSCDFPDAKWQHKLWICQMKCQLITVASQITSLTIVYSTVYLGADQRKHQSSESLAFAGEIHRWPVNSPHKGPVTRKVFPIDDVIMLQRNSQHF